VAGSSVRCGGVCGDQVMAAVLTVPGREPEAVEPKKTGERCRSPDGNREEKVKAASAVLHITPPRTGVFGAIFNRRSGETSDGTLPVPYQILNTNPVLTLTRARAAPPPARTRTEP
jgi:hypothetical protein